MAEYTYKAIDQSNKEVKGTLVALNLNEAESTLRQKGLYPIQVVRKSESQKGKRGKTTTKDVLNFTIQLQFMLDAGMPLLKALDNIAGQESKQAMRLVIQDISKKIETSGSLAEAIASHPRVFPPFYIGAIRAGESGGNLVPILEELVHTIEHQEELSGHLKQALTYPMVIMFALTGVGLFYAFYLMPKLLGLVAELGGEIPLITRFLMFGTDLAKGIWLPALGFLILAGISLFIYSKSNTGKFVLGYMKLKFPLIGPLVQKLALAKFCHYMGLLLGTGFGLIPSLQLVKGTIGNINIVKAVETMEERIKSGESFSQSMQGLVFPPFLISMVAMGEEIGQVPQQLKKINQFYEKDIRRSTQKILTLLEPVILLGFGGFAAVILLSTFLPLYKTISKIQ